VRAPWIKRSLALLLTLLPPYVVAVACPHLFYPILEFSGNFRLVLFGILPAVMVWYGRRQGRTPWLPGGDVTLGGVVIIACVALYFGATGTSAA
jgi:hypothetical protein